MKTGHYNYSTEEDGLCEFDTSHEAVSAACDAAKRSGEQITVYDPQGEKCFIARPDLPTHTKRCMSPETYGFED